MLCQLLSVLSGVSQTDEFYYAGYLTLDAEDLSDFENEDDEFSDVQLLHGSDVTRWCLSSACSLELYAPCLLWTLLSA